MDGLDGGSLEVDGRPEPCRGSFTVHADPRAMARVGKTGRPGIAQAELFHSLQGAPGAGALRPGAR